MHVDMSNNYITLVIADVQFINSHASLSLQEAFPVIDAGFDITDSNIAVDYFNKSTITGCCLRYRSESIFINEYYKRKASQLSSLFFCFVF